MRNYKESDYAMNKYSDGIVYRFADGIVEISLSDYLAENPEKTEADFRALKEISDSDYLMNDRADNAQTKRNSPLNEAVLRHAISPEEILVNKITEQEEAVVQRRRLASVTQILKKLTAVQRRRYLLFVVNGLTEREIAEKEGSTQQAVSKSLCWVEKKIKKFFAAYKK
ncbi:MAG: hypothetical protein LBS21_11270 [Clostridiales bacterium]|nr:hypothetical protein [Clostridiales bacterium]